MSLFWAMFDGILMFVLPILITTMGFSETMMGIIIGTSSVTGIFFDMLLCKFLKNTNFRRMYLFMFVLCAFYPLILWQAKAVWLFLIAMAVWGMYYDFFNIGNFDFVGRHTKKEEHTSSFGVMRVFISLGYMLAPLLGGLLISDIVDHKPFLLSWVFLAIAFLFYILLTVLQRKKKTIAVVQEIEPQPLRALNELHLWKKIGGVIFPILLLTFTLNIIDAFFWTIGPLVSENLKAAHGFGGLFMVAYTLPPLLVGWTAGIFVRKVGKKRTSFYSLAVGSLLLSLFYFLKEHSVILIFTNFIASFCIAIAWPAINGVYADYISEAPHVEKEIETLEDSSTNLGYIIGPMVAGFASEHLGHVETFSILGVFGFIVAIVLMYKTPRHIHIAIK